MAATLNLLPRKKFEIILEDGTVLKGQYGTWALKRFCDRLSVDLQGAQDKLSSMDSLDTVLAFILSTIEQGQREAGAQFSYTDFHAASWLDELGGMLGGAFTQIIQWVSKSETDEEKKSQESPELGEKSSESSIQPD